MVMAGRMDETDAFDMTYHAEPESTPSSLSASVGNENLPSSTPALSSLPLDPPTPSTSTPEDPVLGGPGVATRDNKLLLVMPCLMLVLFLAALDQTIVSTALPTISADFDASEAQYAWVGTAFLLSSTVINTLCGRLSDIVGRKTVLYPGITVFVLGSALCGASQNMNMLIGARALQGLGGGSIQSVTQFIVGDIVPLGQRGMYNALLGSVWGVAAAVGPIAGGLLTEKASWRWCFFINLPTAGVALALLFLFLHLEPVRKMTWDEFLSRFDFPGLALLMSGVALLVVGFATAANDGWASHAVIGLLVAGSLLCLLAGINFGMTTRNPLISPRLFRNRTTGLFMLASLLHAIAFLASTYYLPVFFQGIYDASPLRSGIYLLPFSFCVALGTIVSGQINTLAKIVRPVAWTGYLVATLCYGLMVQYLQYGQSVAAGEVLLGIAGFFVGLALTVPLIVIQGAMPKRDMASSTGAWVLVRSLGGTMGIAIFQAVLSSQLERRITPLPGYGIDYGIPDSVAEYAKLHALVGIEKAVVLAAFSAAMRTLFIIWCPFYGCALLLTLCTRNYAMQHGPDGQPQLEKELRKHALSGSV